MENIMYNKNQFPVNWSTREILQSQIPEEENFLSFSPYDSDLRLDLKYNMNQSTMKDKINNGQWPSLQEINKFNETQNRILYEKEKMKEKTTPQTEEEDSWLDTLQDAGTSFLQGTTFGLQDEFNGIMGALGYSIADVLTGRMPTKETLVSGYVKARDEERERYEKAQERSPMASLVAENLASFISPMGKFTNVTKIPGFQKLKKFPKIRKVLDSPKKMEYIQDGINSLISGFGHAEGNAGEQSLSIGLDMLKALAGTASMQNLRENLGDLAILFPEQIQGFLSDYVKNTPANISDERFWNSVKKHYNSTPYFGPRI